MNSRIKKITFSLLPAAILLLFFLVVVFAPGRAHAEKLYEVLDPTKTTGPSESVRKVWTQIRDLINYLVMAFLIYVAFLNILRTQMNDYAIKKILPALIMGVILANFSFLICRFFVDLSSVGMDILINSPNGANAIGNGNNFGIAGSFALNIDKNQLAPGGILNWGYIFVGGIFALLEFAGSIVILILTFLFFFRNYVIYFLVALSPLAFMVTGIPLAKSAWTQWWKMFMQWTFMPIVSLFWLWIGGLWLGNFRDFAGTNNGGWILSILFAGACYYLAITTPFKMGGPIMGSVNKLGKWGLDRSGASGAYSYYKKRAEVGHKATMQGMYNGVKKYTGIGTGLDRAEARLAMKETARGALSDRAKADFENSNKVQGELQATVILQSQGKETRANAKKRFSESDKGKAMLKTQTRMDIRTATADKGTEEVLSEIKRDYFRSAEPTAPGAPAPNRATQRLAAEVRSYLDSSNNSVTRLAEIEKVEKVLTGKLMTDRISHQNALDRLADATPGTAEHTAAQLEVNAIQTQIAAGSHWGHLPPAGMSSTEKSRTKAQVDKMITEEAQVDLEKDAATIQREMFSNSTPAVQDANNRMLAQDPTADMPTEHKIAFTARRKALDKILSGTSGGKSSPQAQAAARDLLSHMDTVGMIQPRMDSSLDQIVFTYNHSLGPTLAAHSINRAGIRNFTDLQAQADVQIHGNDDARQLFMTSLRSTITQPRGSEQM